MTRGRAHRPTTLKTNWRLLPDRDKWDMPRIALSRPNFACTTSELKEVEWWARRFPDNFAEALEAFKEAMPDE